MVPFSRVTEQASHEGARAGWISCRSTRLASTTASRTVAPARNLTANGPSVPMQAFPLNGHRFGEEAIHARDFTREEADRPRPPCGRKARSVASNLLAVGAVFATLCGPVLAQPTTQITVRPGGPDRFLKDWAPERSSTRLTSPAWPARDNDEQQATTIRRHVRARTDALPPAHDPRDARAAER